MDYPFYSPDLALSEFWLFKKRLTSNQDAK